MTYLSLRAYRGICGDAADLRSDVSAFLEATRELPPEAVAAISDKDCSMLVGDDGQLLEFA